MRTLLRKSGLIWLLATHLLMTSCGKTEQMIDDALDGNHAGSMVEGNNKKSAKPKMSKIIGVKGTNAKKTKVFQIKGSEWKISWKTEPKSAKDGEFIILLKDKRNKDDAEIVANVTGEDEDYRYMTGKGNYYLVINSNQKYEITVEDLR